MNVASLRTAMANYMAAIRNYVDTRTGKSPVSEAQTLASDASISYDLTALIGVDASEYDMLSANIVVKVLDTDTASPTYNLYVNSEAVITSGVDAAGTVTIHNHHSAALDCYIRIDVPVVAGT